MPDFCEKYIWPWNQTYICTYRNRIGFNAEIQIIFGTVHLPPVQGDGEESEDAGGHGHQGSEVVHDAVGLTKVPAPEKSYVKEP